jgi:hypothetical protein
MVTQPLKNFMQFCGIWRFIIILNNSLPLIPILNNSLPLIPILNQISFTLLLFINLTHSINPWKAEKAIQH